MIVEALAAARLTRLVTRDTLTERMRFTVDELEAEGRVPLGAGEFVRCRWCVAAWAALVVGALRQSRPGRIVVRVLAVAQIAAWLTPPARWDDAQRAA